MILKTITIVPFIVKIEMSFFNFYNSKCDCQPLCVLHHPSLWDTYAVRKFNFNIPKKNIYIVGNSKSGIALRCRLCLFGRLCQAWVVKWSYMFANCLVTTPSLLPILFAWQQINFKQIKIVYKLSKILEILQDITRMYCHFFILVGIISGFQYVGCHKRYCN